MRSADFPKDVSISCFLSRYPVSRAVFWAISLFMDRFPVFCPISRFIVCFRSRFKGGTRFGTCFAVRVSCYWDKQGVVIQNALAFSIPTPRGRNRRPAAFSRVACACGGLKVPKRVSLNDAQKKAGAVLFLE